MRLTIAACILSASIIFAQENSQEPAQAPGLLAEVSPVAQAVSSNFTYMLMPPNTDGDWTIIQEDANAASSADTKTMYTGPFPFQPEPSQEILKTLGTDTVRSLITQWVATVLANGQEEAKAEFDEYYTKNGKPMYTGLTAEIFRSQGVDPEAAPVKPGQVTW